MSDLAEILSWVRRQASESRASLDYAVRLNNWHQNHPTATPAEIADQERILRQEYGRAA